MIIEQGGSTRSNEGNIQRFFYIFVLRKKSGYEKIVYHHIDSVIMSFV